jgi:hypothetical protein
VSGGKVPGRVHAQLTALVGGEAGIPDAAVVAPVAAGVEPPLASERAPEVQIDPLHSLEARGAADRAAERRSAGLADEVDDAARRAGAEHRGAAAADGLDARDRLVEAGHRVREGEEETGWLEHRQAVLLQPHVPKGALLGDGQPAHGDVGARLAGIAHHLKAGGALEQLGCAARRLLEDLLLAERGDRRARLELRCGIERPRHDDRLERERVGAEDEIHDGDVGAPHLDGLRRLTVTESLSPHGPAPGRHGLEHEAAIGARLGGERRADDAHAHAGERTTSVVGDRATERAGLRAERLGCDECERGERRESEAGHSSGRRRGGGGRAACAVGGRSAQGPPRPG